MFYDDKKTKEENKHTYEKTVHNRECIVIITALVALGTGLLTLAVASNKAAREFY